MTAEPLPPLTAAREAALVWGVVVEDLGSRALDDVREALHARGLEGLEHNLLASLGRLVDDAFRRRLLRYTLELHGWHLSRTAISLRMTGGPSAVLREMKKLGLMGAYHDFRVTHGRSRRGPPPQNQPGYTTHAAARRRKLEARHGTR